MIYYYSLTSWLLITLIKVRQFPCKAIPWILFRVFNTSENNFKFTHQNSDSDDVFLIRHRTLLHSFEMVMRSRSYRAVKSPHEVRILKVVFTFWSSGPKFENNAFCVVYSSLCLSGGIKVTCSVELINFDSICVNVSQCHRESVISHFECSELFQNVSNQPVTMARHATLNQSLTVDANL